jgi:phage tail sheath protein FI
VIDGNYSTNSNYVRVEVSSYVDQQAVDATALPFGVRGIPHLVTSGSRPLTSVAGSDWLKTAVTPPVVFRDTITAGAGTKASVNPLLYWGYQFEHITSLDTKNASKLANDSMKSFVKYYPEFMTNTMNFAVGDNPGAVTTDENGVVDADKFNRTLFALDNIQVITGSSTYADSSKWKDAVYVRSGLITADDVAKTRRFSTTDLTQANRRFAKFTFPMFGGFDGTNIFDREETKISNTAVTYDMLYDSRGRNAGPNVQAYLKAIEVMNNVVNTDIQLFTIPGIRHELITDTAMTAVEDRFDAMLVMDVEETDADGNVVLSGSQLPSVSKTVETFTNRSLNSSFAAAYFPDVLMQDPTTKTNLHVPPSVMVMGALALNDAVGYPWFAPAGYARGALEDALEAKVRLSKNNLDDLYDVNINPIVAFPGNATQGTNPAGGVLVWGQKTVYQTASALDRVNVRRLLIELRRQVRDVARTILFEPNRAATLSRFSAAVTPKLEKVQSLAGIEQFRVIIDSSTTTQADVENNTIRGKIIIQPTRSVEFVSLDFVVSNTI